MSTRFRDPLGSQPYVDPAAAPDSVPKVDEIGVTSGPLKSAAFFIGKFCQAYNGQQTLWIYLLDLLTELCVDDFMQCKAENRDPAHCLKEGRRVTRCATELCVPIPTSRITLTNISGCQSCARTAKQNGTSIGTVSRTATTYDPSSFASPPS